MNKLSFCSLTQYLNEEIDPLEATDPKGAIKSVIDGRREVGYDRLGKAELRKLKNAGVEYVVVPRNDSLTYYIFYTNEEKARRLYDISQRHGGKLSPKSPEEAREIGALLGYEKDSIDDYVRKKFSYKVPIVPNVNIEDLSDYD
jgi:hypothetical protein